jgi:hypothetical protein
LSSQDYRHEPPVPWLNFLDLRTFSF